MSKITRLFTAAMTLVITAVTLSFPAAGAPAYADVRTGAVSVSAEAALLLDASDGSVLYSRNADERLPMASTTKIMTALVALETGDLSSIVEVSPKAVGVEGSSVYLQAGERLSLEALVYALMLESANDAAAAIAIEIAGDIDDFAALMNEKAAELGLADTHFTNPHGLDNEQHYTTAYDLARLTAYALKNQAFRTIVSTRKKTIPLNGTEGVRLLVNHNRMLRSYDGAIGVKTGFTKRSGRCLVSAAERGNLTLVAVTINAPDDWNDHKSMLNWGFDSYVRVRLAGEREYRMTMPVTGGLADWTVCTNTDAIEVTLPASHGRITCSVEAPRFLFAPVTSGTVVGRLIYYCDGAVIGESQLITAVDVERRIVRSGFFEWLRRLFGL